MYGKHFHKCVISYFFSFFVYLNSLFESQKIVSLQFLYFWPIYQGIPVTCSNLCRFIVTVYSKQSNGVRASCCFRVINIPTLFEHWKGGNDDQMILRRFKRCFMKTVVEKSSLVKRRVHAPPGIDFSRRQT